MVDVPQHIVGIAASLSKINDVLHRHSWG